MGTNMTWETVVSKLDFWNEGDSWGDVRIKAFSADELNFVINSLFEFYLSSQTARNALEDLASRGEIRIGRASDGSFTTFVGQFIGFDPDEQTVTISTQGSVIPRLPEYVLMHELFHLFTQRPDLTSLAIGDQNSAIYD